MNDKVAIAIPAYEAGAVVGDVVRRALAVLPVVLVVDDGSSDDTASSSRAAGAEVVSQPQNLGKGAALRRAFTVLFERGFEAVVTLDADGQHLPEEIGKLLEAWARGAHLILGGRNHHFDGMNRLRRTSNRLSSRAISWVAGRRFDDIQTGFRLYTKPLIRATAFPESRFEAESAVIVRAVRAGLVVVTVPVDLGFADGRATSHYRPVVDSLRIAGAVLRARFERRNRQ